MHITGWGVGWLCGRCVLLRLLSWRMMADRLLLVTHSSSLPIPLGSAPRQRCRGSMLLLTRGIPSHHTTHHLLGHTATDNNLHVPLDTARQFRPDGVWDRGSRVKPLQITLLTKSHSCLCNAIRAHTSYHGTNYSLLHPRAFHVIHGKFLREAIHSIGPWNSQSILLSRPITAVKYIHLHIALHHKGVPLSDSRLRLCRINWYQNPVWAISILCYIVNWAKACVTTETQVLYYTQGKLTNATVE